MKSDFKEVIKRLDSLKNLEKELSIVRKLVNDEILNTEHQKILLENEYKNK